ncbi:MAG: CapA family protein, partial [Chthonomonadales bacterium]
DPTNAKALKDAGFKIVCLANNHSLDYDRPALVETIAALERNGIPFAGAGRTKADAHRAVILNVKGLKVAFLAYLGLFPAILPEREGKPSVAMAEATAIRRDIAAVRSQVDFVIVSLHAGVERKRHHSSRQENIAHTMVDAGADMVIGHHPHVVQDFETYKGKPIFYSLGNFVFEPSASCRQEGGKHWSGMIRATLERGKPIVATFEELKLVGRQPRLNHN